MEFRHFDTDENVRTAVTAVVDKYYLLPDAEEVSTYLVHDEFGSIQARVVRKNPNELWVQLATSRVDFGEFWVDINNPGSWDLYHREIDPPFRGKEFGNVAMEIVEEVARRANQILTVNLCEGARGENGVQWGVYKFLAKRGFTPVDPVAGGILEDYDAAAAAGEKRLGEVEELTIPVGVTRSSLSFVLMKVPN